MPGRRALAIALVTALALVLAACTLPPLETPTPTAQPTPAATPTPSATAVAATAESASPSIDPSTVPTFSGGEIVVTTFAGLRVRQLPGIDRPVTTGLLPSEAALSVVMGPILEDDLGWYLVADADARDPVFEEGWVAAGTEPDANLRSTGLVDDDTPVVVSFAQTGDAQFGPIEIPDEKHLVRWVAVDPEGVRCQFAILLAAGSAAPVPAIRSTVGDALIAGTLQSSFFVSQPSLRGQVFLTAESDCAWALAVVREEPAPTPSP